MKRAAIYVRVSREEQASEDKASIPEQLGDLEELCESKGYEIVGRYVEDRRYRSKGRLVEPSGMRKDRPEYQRMLKDAKEGKIDVILAWDDTRLSRGVFATVPLGELLEEHPEIEVDLVHGVFDRNMLFIKASIGKIEIDNIKRRMMMGRRAKAKQGKFPGGRAAYGYRYNPETEELEINDSEAEIVKKIFSWYVDGEGARNITRRLNSEGIPTKDNSRQGWNKTLVLSILRRESYYLGETTFGDIAVPCPPIIGSETWESAQRVKAQNTVHCRRNLQTTYLLRNLLYCEECGRRLYVKTKYRRRNGARYVSSRAYQCATSRDYTGLYEDCKPLIYINADTLEELVWTELDRLLRSPEMLGAGVRDQLAVMEEQVNEAKSRAGVLKKKLESLDRERQTVITWARMGKITETDMALQLLEIEGRERAYQEDYEGALEMQSQKAQEFDAQRFAVEFCRKVSDKLQWLSSEPLSGEKAKQRRELAKILLRRVWINNKGEIRIEGRIPQVEPDFEYASPR